MSDSWIRWIGPHLFLSPRICDPSVTIINRLSGFRIITSSSPQKQKQRNGFTRLILYSAKLPTREHTAHTTRTKPRQLTRQQPSAAFGSGGFSSMNAPIQNPNEPPKGRHQPPDREAEAQWGWAHLAQDLQCCTVLENGSHELVKIEANC